MALVGVRVSFYINADHDGCLLEKLMYCEVFLYLSKWFAPAGGERTSSDLENYNTTKSGFNIARPNNTTLPCFQFSMNCQGFTVARLTWPAYVDGRKLENCSV